MRRFNYKDKRGESDGSGMVITLALIFIFLKFFHVINWPWLWVLCPIWIPLILGGVMLLIIGLITLIIIIVKSL
jgi:hypothetical protein